VFYGRDVQPLTTVPSSVLDKPAPLTMSGRQMAEAATRAQVPYLISN